MLQAVDLDHERLHPGRRPEEITSPEPTPFAPGRPQHLVETRLGYEPANRPRMMAAHPADEARLILGVHQVHVDLRDGACRDAEPRRVDALWIPHGRRNVARQRTPRQMAVHPEALEQDTLGVGVERGGRTPTQELVHDGQNMARGHVRRSIVTTVLACHPAVRVVVDTLQIDGPQGCTYRRVLDTPRMFAGREDITFPMQGPVVPSYAAFPQAWSATVGVSTLAGR